MFMQYISKIETVEFYTKNYNIDAQELKYIYRYIIKVNSLFMSSVLSFLLLKFYWSAVL